MAAKKKAAGKAAKNTKLSGQKSRHTKSSATVASKPRAIRKGDSVRIRGTGRDGYIYKVESTFTAIAHGGVKHRSAILDDCTAIQIRSLIRVRKPRSDKGTKMAHAPDAKPVRTLLVEDWVAEHTHQQPPTAEASSAPHDVLQPLSDVNSYAARYAALTEKYGKGWYDKVWIVGRVYGEAWDFQGAFWKEEDAAAACQDDTWFIGPADINVALPAETTSWPGCYYPNATTAVVFENSVEVPAGTQSVIEPGRSSQSYYRLGLLSVALVVLAALAFGVIP